MVQDPRHRGLRLSLRGDPVIHPPWAHQTEALEFIAEKPGAMLAMDMGTGKSRVIVDLIARKGYEKVLILAPLSVVQGV